ncbi:MAG: aldehyde:ferredoxin oxidoreductase, partial [Oscillospiraceae bacterium]|nr:aldehyde:ferredoxin oxidoreductase [Oscillospiraceae bacterium]
MTDYCGYMGKVLLLDLSTGRTENYIWTDLDREKYIGGKAMASKILYDNLTGAEKPFDPENLIVIATGPLTGTGAPSSNRFDISSLSPLTGITASSNCGGNFGLYLKKAGLDALIIRGKCETLSWLEIDNGEFIFHNAQELRDLKCGETQAALQEKLNAEHGKKVSCGMICIGPAGENLVRFASVISGERAAGRAGMGAVFGSKNLKGITAAGDAIPSIYDREGAAAHRKKWVNDIRRHP